MLGMQGLLAPLLYLLRTEQHRNWDGSAFQTQVPPSQICDRKQEEAGATAKSCQHGPLTSHFVLHINKVSLNFTTPAEELPYSPQHHYCIQ